jgi:PKD domain-containing protein
MGRQRHQTSTQWMETTLRRSMSTLSFVICAGTWPGVAGCSSHDVSLSQNGSATSNAAANHPPSGDTGTVGVALQVAPGITINSVTYTLAGPSGFTQSGTIDVTMSPTVSALLGGIPAGSGYAITLSGVSTDGSVTCSGESSAFTVIANQTTSVPVALACSGATPESGTISVNAMTSQCPTIDSISMIPATVVVGGSLSLIAGARGLNSAGLTYSWTASSGSLANPTSPIATYTCTSAGTPTITLTVSDGGDAAACIAVQSVSVACTLNTMAP